MVLAIFYGIFVSLFLSHSIILDTNNFLFHQIITENQCLQFDLILIFNRLAYIESAVEIYTLDRLWSLNLFSYRRKNTHH